MFLGEGGGREGGREGGKQGGMEESREGARLPRFRFKFCEWNAAAR